MSLQTNSKFSCFRKLQGDSYHKSFQDRGLNFDSHVFIYAIVANDVKEVGKARISDAPSHKKIEMHGVPLSRNEKEDLVVNNSVAICTDSKDIPYPYTFGGVDEAPSELSGMIPSGFYAWDTRLMLPLAPSQNPIPTGHQLPTPFKKTSC